MLPALLLLCQIPAISAQALVPIGERPAPWTSPVVDGTGGSMSESVRLALAPALRAEYASSHLDLGLGGRGWIASSDGRFGLFVQGLAGPPGYGFARGTATLGALRLAVDGYYGVLSTSAFIAEAELSQTYGAVELGLPVGSGLRLHVHGRGLGYRLCENDESSGEPWTRRLEGGLGLSRDRTAWNRGLALDLLLDGRWTDVLYAPYGGVISDDFELLDAYGFFAGELGWNQVFPLAAQPTPRTLRLEWGGRAGWLHRNVQSVDELHLGGSRPFYWDERRPRPHAVLAGYPTYAVSAETLALTGLHLWLPLLADPGTGSGFLRMEELSLRAGSSAGNAWSWTLEDDPDLYYQTAEGDIVALDPADIERERPFAGISHATGQSVLVDVSLELRFRGRFGSLTPWEGFLGLAQGLRPLSPGGGTDATWDTDEGAFGDSTGSEDELPGLRIYLGVGTGA